MKFLELKVPPVLLVSVFVALMWMVSRNADHLGLGFSLRIALSVLLGVASVSLVLVGVLSFNRAKTTVNPVKPEFSSLLVQNGIYRYTRNPMYLGFTLFLLGLGFLLDSFYAMLLVPLFVCYMTRFQIKPEERALARLFGDDFKTYQSRTRRWL